MTESINPEPRVFTLHYPLGSSIDKSGLERENSILAQEVCQFVQDTLAAGKDPVVALPNVDPDWIGQPEMSQWQLREVQKIDEEKYEQLREVAKAAVELMRTYMPYGIQLPHDDDKMQALHNALHKAGFEWEELT